MSLLLEVSRQTLVLWFLDCWKENRTEFLLAEGWWQATFVKMILKTGMLD